MTDNTLITSGWDENQTNLIKRTMAPNANDDELAMFLYQARRTGLDPLARQIYFQKFNTKKGPRVSVLTSIDGYRLVADRTGQYAGSDDYLYDEGLDRYTHITSGRNGPTTATVTVYKMVQNHRVPFTATASWDEYYPTGENKGFMWDKMPYLMLGKCAEALALRKAFPAELSGVYTKEEMDQAGGEIVDITPTEIAEFPHNNPSKGVFFKKIFDTFEFEPAEAAAILKDNGFTNGYDPANAPAMWVVVEKEHDRLRAEFAASNEGRFVERVIKDIPFYAFKLEVLDALAQLGLQYNLENEELLFDALAKYANQKADEAA